MHSKVHTMKLPTITNITEIRRAPKKVFDGVVRLKQPTVIVRKSKSVAVILDIDSYEQLVARNEQLEQRVFTKRPLKSVETELADAHPDDPQLVADVMAGLKRSSLYAKRPASAR